jgi:hypothetical protein
VLALRGAHGLKLALYDCKEMSKEELLLLQGKRVFNGRVKFCGSGDGGELCKKSSGELEPGYGIVC